MRLTAFQSDKGDCLLLTDTSGTRRILVDGGMPASYKAHVAAAMGKLGAAKAALDVVYVSHIDQDHIGGVLTMLDDEADWRVHEFQKKNKNTKSKPPAVARPPKVKEIWHNAFHEQLKDNAGPIEDALAAVAPMLSGSDLAKIRDEGLKQSDLDHEHRRGDTGLAAHLAEAAQHPAESAIGRQADDAAQEIRSPSKSAI